MISMIQVLTLIIFSLLSISCVTDVLYRSIKNYCVLLIFFSSCGLAFCFSNINILLPLLCLLIGFILTVIGIIGAGDIKLIIALLVGMPQEHIAMFFFTMGCLGSPLAILIAILSNIFLKKKDKTVPFGIAITFGYIAAMWGVI